MIDYISFEEGKHILDTCPGSILLDVRTEEEYGIEHAAGAVLLPQEDLETMDEGEILDVLPDLDAPVLLYCRTGRRAALAAVKLEELGYTRLYNLGGPYGMEYGLL